MVPVDWACQELAAEDCRESEASVAVDSQELAASVVVVCQELVDCRSLESVSSPPMDFSAECVPHRSRVGKGSDSPEEHGLP